MNVKTICISVSRVLEEAINDKWYKWENFQVLAQRHKQEQEELMNRFDEEKEEVVNKALSALENRLIIMN